MHETPKLELGHGLAGSARLQHEAYRKSNSTALHPVSFVSGMEMKDAAEFGVAASALKHTIPGDLNHATLSEVNGLMKGDASGRVQR